MFNMGIRRLLRVLGSYDSKIQGQISFLFVRLLSLDSQIIHGKPFSIKIEILSVKTSSAYLLLFHKTEKFPLFIELYLFRIWF